jgi:hypothetical protein
MPWEEPDDAVLLELGRLTWAAINLEDVLGTMRRALGPVPGRLDRAPPSDLIKNALEVLSAWPESETRATACKWFRAAKEALDERNIVLHSVPVVLMSKTSDGFKEHGPALDHIPRSPARPVRRIALTTDGVRVVSRKLTDARLGWVDICGALLDQRKRSGDSTY